MTEKRILFILCCNLIIHLGFSAIAESSNSPLNTVTLYTGLNFEGANQTVNLSKDKCISSIGKVLNEGLASINTNGNCVNIYKETNCTGDYIVIKPGTPAHENLARWDPQWDHTGWISGRAKSLSTCFDKCSPENIQIYEQNQVTFVTEIRYKGLNKTLEVKKCHNLAHAIKRKVTSLKVEGPVCIELYKNMDCSGDSIQVRKGTSIYLTDDLASWGFDKKAASVSLCGFNCLPKKIKWPRKVILYSAPNFYGISKKLNLYEEQCLKLKGKWEEYQLTKSISILSDMCVNIFEENQNCNRKSGKVTRLTGSISDISTLKGFQGIRSIAICPK